MNEKQYKTLKVGDVRMLGDEVRKKIQGYHKIDRNLGDRLPRGGIPIVGDWSSVSLIGHAILPADLFNAEFRRRII